MSASTVVRKVRRGDRAALKKAFPETEAMLFPGHKVLPGSAFIAEADGRITGTGYLLKEDGQALDLGWETEVSLEGVLAAETLLSRYRTFWREYQAAFLDNEKPVLRVWCREKHRAFRGLLEENGFTVQEQMFLMEKALSEADHGKRSRRVKRYRTDEEEQPAQARSYAVFEGEQPVAFATVCPGSPGRSGMSLSRSGTQGVKEPAPFYRIRNVFTEENFRRQGFATELLLDLEARLYAEGAAEIRLTVDVRNRPAIRLYRALGFDKTGKLLGYWLEEA